MPLGLTTADLALQVRHALFGFEVQDLQAERDEVTVRVLLPEAARNDLGDLARLRLKTPSGARVPLGEGGADHDHPGLRQPVPGRWPARPDHPRRGG